MTALCQKADMQQHHCSGLLPSSQTAGPEQNRVIQTLLQV